MTAPRGHHRELPQCVLERDGRARTVQRKEIPHEVPLNGPQNVRAARRLQVQERLTNEIRDCIQDTLQPAGVAVVIECRHLCMSMRGVEKQNSFDVTSAMLGGFRDNARPRMEFLELIRHRGTTASWASGPALTCINE